MSEQTHDIFTKQYDELKARIDGVDLHTLSIEELKELYQQAEQTQKIYRNFELVVKKDANSLYGSSGNAFFSLVDYNLATDITTSGKHFGLIVDEALNKFFVNWGAQELKVIQEFYPDVTYLRPFLEYKPDTKNDVCVYGDTDSRYIDLGIIYELMNKSMPQTDTELANFGVFIHDRFFVDIIKNTIDKDIEYRNATKGHMKMSHEVITRKCVFQKKKKYAMAVIWKDGKLLHDRKLVYKGVEIRKGEINKRVKYILEQLVSKFLNGILDYRGIQKMVLKIINHITMAGDKGVIYRISSVNGLSEIRFCEKSDRYICDKTHIQMQIALSWYNFIHKNKLQDVYQFPFDGQKMNFYYDINGNVMGVPDDVEIDKVPNLPPVDWQRMLKQILVQPILKYILEKDTISDADVEDFIMLKTKLF